MKPPKLPYDLEIKHAFWRDAYVVVVAETKEVIFEFIWDGVSDSLWEEVILYRKAVYDS